MPSKAIVRTLAALAACACLSAAAQTAEPLEEPDCEDAERDSELRAAYEPLLGALPREGEVLLERAQRAWLEYRDASCELYSARPGHPDIAASALATCLDFMTRERALELRLVGRLTAP
ncbi:MAG TPA: lysozyme inhibitor LprI family protein [Burkholderiales bacterium]|nr:lysozyme inhibitor LprI family protein [Burkholderiales bacterium]